MNDEKLKVTKLNAKIAYEAADSNGKILLEKLFPGVLKPVLITDRIKTFDDVLNYHGITKADFDDANEGLEPDEVSYRQMKLITRALNELKPGEKLDPSKVWYTPYFNRVSGFGFSNACYGHWYSNASVGSRLSFKTAALAIYAGQTFPDIYKPFMLEY